MSAAYTVRSPTTRIELELNAGDPINLLIPILDDNCDPVTIPAGTEHLWGARAQVRRNVFAVEVLYEWTTSGANPNAEIVPGTPGMVRLLAASDETALWQRWVDYTCGWDLDVIEPAVYGGGSNRIAQGPFRVLPEYTR